MENENATKLDYIADKVQKFHVLTERLQEVCNR